MNNQSLKEHFSPQITKSNIFLSCFMTVIHIKEVFILRSAFKAVIRQHILSSWYCFVQQLQKTTCSSCTVLVCCCFPSSMTSNYEWVKHWLIKLHLLLIGLQPDFIIISIVLNFSFRIPPWSLMQISLDKNVSVIYFLESNNNAQQKVQLNMQHSNNAISYLIG